MQSGSQVSEAIHKIPGYALMSLSGAVCVQELAHHWATKYDWRKHEAYLNRFPQFKLLVNGIDLHFVHLRSSDPDAVPLLLSHGWPGSFYGALVAVRSGAAAALPFFDNIGAQRIESLLHTRDKGVWHVVALSTVWRLAEYIHPCCFPHPSNSRVPSAISMDPCLITCKFLCMYAQAGLKLPHIPHAVLHARPFKVERLPASIWRVLMCSCACAEFHKMFEALAAPKAAADGSKPQAFHVIAPSLPGYGFSSAPQQPGFGVEKIAQTFDALMSALGYQTYVAQGARHAPAGWSQVPAGPPAPLQKGFGGHAGVHNRRPPSTASPPRLSMDNIQLECRGALANRVQLLHVWWLPSRQLTGGCMRRRRLGLHHQRDAGAAVPGALPRHPHQHGLFGPVLPQPAAPAAAGQPAARPAPLPGVPVARRDAGGAGRAVLPGARDRRAHTTCHIRRSNPTRAVIHSLLAVCLTVYQCITVYCLVCMIS